MILSSSTLFDALLPSTGNADAPMPAVSFSEEWLDLSRALLVVAGHSLSALGLQLELHRKRMADDTNLQSLDAFPRAAELLSVLRAAEDLTDEGIYLSSVIWSLARGLPDATVHLEGFERIPLQSLQQAEALLHCAREGLLSAARYDASEVWLRLRQSAGWISVEVEDDGDHFRERPAHDLIGLRTRINALNGKLRVKDRQPNGWKLVANLPRQPDSH